MLNLTKIGNTIRIARTAAGISQEELADKLYVTRQAVSRWEKGAALPTIDNIVTLTELLSMDFQTLLCLDTPATVDPDNPFVGKDRSVVLSGIIRGEIKVNLVRQFYRFSDEERIILLSEIKNGNPLIADAEYVEFWTKLSDGEKQYFNLKKYKEELNFGLTYLKKK